jgi:hypothetical protein
MKIPPTFVIFRAVAVTMTVLLLLLLGLGLSGRGPLGGLGTVTSHAAGWLRINTQASHG